VLQIRYPGPAQDPVAMAAVWRGMCEQVFRLTNAPGQVASIGAVDGVVEAQLRWG
jgi:hypothetical protein